jgi:hypothetical protein
MKTPLTFLLSLTFLFLFSSSVYGDNSKDKSAVIDPKFMEMIKAFTEHDSKKLYDLNLPLAQEGDQFAQWNIGNFYLRGDGVEQDYKEAFKWYSLSAKQGHKRAQFDLGVMYDNGEGIPIDYKEAVKWFRLSAEQGYANAQLNLGVKYAKGQGVPQDYVLAHMWLNLLGSSGDKKAVKLKNLVEKKMTPSQIEKAQEMARNWKPTKK